MTEKRFTLGYEDDFLRWIRDNPNRKNYVVKIGFGEEDNLQDVCDLLNQLNNENEQLKRRNKGLQSELQIFKEDVTHSNLQINKLTDENEQLKQFKEDVFTKIDMHLRMLPTARDNEFNEDDGDPSLYNGAIYMLETLKKELEE